MTVNEEYPGAGGAPPHVDLGDGHTIRWTEYQGQRVGGIIRHDKADMPRGYCEGAFWLKGNAFNVANPRENRAEWSFNGDFEKPSLEPSFLCHCGDHGFVREGKWVRA